jgi:hypothetical protein
MTEQIIIEKQTILSEPVEVSSLAYVNFKKIAEGLLQFYSVILILRLIGKFFGLEKNHSEW